MNRFKLNMVLTYTFFKTIYFLKYVIVSYYLFLLYKLHFVTNFLTLILDFFAFRMINFIVYILLKKNFIVYIKLVADPRDAQKNMKHNAIKKVLLFYSVRTIRPSCDHIYFINYYTDTCKSTLIGIFFS